jgi:hypothetical protein
MAVRFQVGRGWCGRREVSSSGPRAQMEQREHYECADVEDGVSGGPNALGTRRIHG